MLLERQRLSAREALVRLAGLQAQSPPAPYVGLWTRLRAFRPDELAGLIEERAAVRIALMRGTIHLVTAEDCLWMRPLVQPVLDSQLRGSRRNLDGVDREALVAEGTKLLARAPRSHAELGELLAPRWPQHEPEHLAMAMRAWAPLVQVPPRGLWGKSGGARHTTVKTWLGRALARRPDPGELVLRYLAAFGPATVKDVQTWSGLSRLAEVVEGLRPQLRTFEGPSGEELLDVPDGPLPDPDTPAPPRFLPEYDNTLLSHANRDRVVAPGDVQRVFTRGALLVDGFLRGAWKIARKSGTATLQIEAFKRLAKADRAEVAEEGARLLDFAAAEARERRVRFEAL